MAGEIWKSNENRFCGCQSSFVDKFRQRAPSGYESGVLFFTGWVVDVVGISLIDRR